MSNTHKIKLKGGKRTGYAIVDKNNRQKVEDAGPWFLHKTGYAYRNTTINGKPITIYLHRFILGLVPGDKYVADHIDGNKLNNIASNLRAVTVAENNQNITKTKGQSRFRGVSKAKDKWQASVNAPNGKRFKKVFACEKEAAIWADELRQKHLPYALPDKQVQKLKEARC